jgi:hypothetical protein
MVMYYKSLDLLLKSVVKEELKDTELDTVERLMKKLDDLNSLVYGLYAVSGMYPEIKFKTGKYTGVNYGKDS